MGVLLPRGEGEGAVCLRCKHQSSDQRAAGLAFLTCREGSAHGRRFTLRPRCQGDAGRHTLLLLGSEVTGLLRATQGEAVPWDAFHLCQHPKPRGPAVILPLRTEDGQGAGACALCPHSAGPGLGLQHQDLRDTVQPE